MNKNNTENNIHEYYSGRDALSPVPTRVNSPVIKPENINKMNAIAVQTMEWQAQQQLEILRRQANVIMEEIRNIENRIQTSHLIYSAELKFKPLIGNTYYLYEKEGKYSVSMISEREWGTNMPFDRLVNIITLLADHTWQINNQ